jgi:CO dehydrogenase maturation factor
VAAQPPDHPRNIKALASDLSMALCLVVVSKISDAAGRQFIIANMPDFEILGFISYNTTVADADIQGVGVYDAAPAAAEAARKIRVVLESVIGK